MNPGTKTPKPASQLEMLFRDIKSSLAHWRFWVHLGLEDILKQYRRSYLGPIWISINTAIFIAAFSIIGSQVFKIALAEYIIFFCLGHILFSFISALISEGCQTFISAEAFLKQTPFPKLAFVFRVIWRNIINVAHNMPLLLIALVFYGDILKIRLDVFLMDLILTIFSAILLLSSLGAVCARFRDVPMIITSLMQIAMFVTPVMWKPEQLSDRARFIVYINPLAAYLELLRAPLMGKIPSIHYYATALAATIILFIGFFSIFLKSRKHLVYWL